MKLFTKYIRQRWREIAAGMLFVTVFIISFALYKLPVKAVLYPAMLCLLLGIFFAVMDFLRVRRKHELLTQMQIFTDAMMENLPAIEGIEEEDYQNLVDLLRTEHGEVITESRRKYSEMVDYYTMWAHQIKTPISAMKLTLQNEDTEFSRKLSNDLFRIEQYVEMVLTFLRLGSESTDYVIKEYDLDEILRQAVKKFSGEFISRKISLVYEPLHTTVITDEKWLSFVIEQILSNALKYTPSGSITIRLEPDNNLCICDTGIGIAPEDLPRIFENGYTGYNGRADKRASGIGLYLCKRICGKLGHGIMAESKVDEGTTIILDLSRRKIELE
ncbi:MAG: sensor histidine kinase [Roseburia sp.]